jgi:hypothetical protein
VTVTPSRDPGPVAGLTLPSEPRPEWLRPTVSVAVLMAASLLFLFAGEGISDVSLDWASTKGAWDGTGAFQTIETFQEPHGGRPWSVRPGGVHPRTPGGLLLQTPLLLVPVSLLQVVWALLSAILLAGMVQILASHLRMRLTDSALWIIAVLGAPAVWVNFQAGSGSALLGLLLTATPILILRDRPGWAGVCFGIAATLRLFPLVLAPLLVLWPAALVAAGAVFLATNVIGLMLPGVTLSTAWDSISDATPTWFFAPNASLARLLHEAWDVPVDLAVPLGAGVCAVALLALAWKIRNGAPLVPAWFAGIAFMLFATPNSWVNYGTMLVGAVLVLAAAYPERRRLILGLSVLLLLGALPFLARGHVTAQLFSRSVLLAAMLWLTLRPPQRRASLPSDLKSVESMNR